jgi:type I restriction enzyme S subunit
MSWELVKLGELITESRIPSENPDPDRRITVRLNVLGVEKRALENEKAGATKQFIRKAGQFIYGKQNFHKGAFGIIPVELDGFESSADLPSFDVREDCLSEWIFYFFKQGGYYLELAKIARGVATQRIHPEQIYDLEIPLPDIETQKKIIASIKSIEDKGDKLNKELSYQLTLVEQLNQAILQEAVQGKLVNQDPNDEPASELLKRIKAEKATLRQAQGKGKKEKPLPPIKPEEIPFEIPENWVWCRLGEMSINRDGERKPISQAERNGRQKIYDYYGASGVIDKIDGYTHEGELLLIGEDGANLVTRSTPIAFIAKGQFWVNNHAHVLDTVDRITLDYLCAYINSIDLKPFVTGGFQPKLSQGNLNIIPVPLPPLSEQKRIVAEIEKQLAKTKQLKEHIIANQQATEQLLKALLHQAFEVKEVETV